MLDAKNIKYAGYAFIAIGVISAIASVSKNGFGIDWTGPLTLIGLGTILVVLSK